MKASQAVQNAVMKAIASEWEEAKADVGTTSFRGKVVIDLDLVVSRGEDVNASVAIQIPWMKVCLLSLSRSGFQREAIEQLIIQLAEECVNEPDKNSELLSEFEETIEKFKERLSAKLPKKPRSGGTKCKGIVRIADIVPFVDPLAALSSVETIEINDGIGIVGTQMVQITQ